MGHLTHRHNVPADTVDQIAELQTRADAQLALVKEYNRRIKTAARRGDHAAVLTHVAHLHGHQDNADAANATIRRLLTEDADHA